MQPHLPRLHTADCSHFTGDVFYLAACLSIYLVSLAAAAAAARRTVIIFARQSIYILLKVALPHLCLLLLVAGNLEHGLFFACNHSFRHFTKLYRRRSFSLLICLTTSRCCCCCCYSFSFFRLARYKKSFYLNKFLGEDMRGISI